MATSALMQKAPMAIELAAKFKETGHTLALVGGPVRDAILGRLGNDLDLLLQSMATQQLKLRLTAAKFTIRILENQMLILEILLKAISIDVISLLMQWRSN